MNMFILSPTFNFRSKDECLVVDAFEKWKNQNGSCEDPKGNNTWIRLEKLGDQCLISVRTYQDYERSLENVKLVGEEKRRL